MPLQFSRISNHLPKGYFQDAERFKKVIGVKSWKELVYYEAAVELDDSSNPKHRYVVICRNQLFVFSTSYSRDVSELDKACCHHIAFKRIQSIQDIQHRSEIFEVDKINEHTSEFIVHFTLRGSKASKRKRKTLHLAAWESGSTMFFRLLNAWLTYLVSWCLRAERKIQNPTDSTAMEAAFQGLSGALLKGKSTEANIVTLGRLHKLVEERSIKKLFFRDQNLILFVLQSLDANALPASLNLEQYDDKKSDYEQLNMSRLRYVKSLLKLLQLSLVDSECIEGRQFLLQPSPIDFISALQILTLDFNSEYIRSRHLKAQRRSKMENGEDAEFSDDDDEGLVLMFLDDDDGCSVEENVLLQQINSSQVDILVEIDKSMELAIRTGTSRALVSDTLAQSLAKLGTDFSYHWLPIFVKRLVDLLKSWKTNKEEGHVIDDQEEANICVDIFKYARLLHSLVLGNFGIRESLMENNSEELHYYLFKDEYVQTNLMENATPPLLRLNQISVRYLGVIEEVMHALEARKKK